MVVPSNLTIGADRVDRDPGFMVRDNDIPSGTADALSLEEDVSGLVYQAVVKNYSQMCFEKAAAAGKSGRAEQVYCLADLLNVTDMPSVYAFNNFTATYQPLGCMLANATLEDRFRFPGVYHYCTIPDRGPDVFLFASLALLTACFLFGKLSTVWVLVTGCLLATLNYFVNLLEIGNSVALWLNIQPPELFLYAFLPPLIVEQAIRIDFYLFKKNFVHSVMLAVVMVILTTIILTPLILFVLGFHSDGWTWVYAGLFSAIIAPTDALAVASVLKRSNGPALLTNLLESESLLNDATGITLFQIFFEIIRNPSIPSNSPSVWSVIPTIIKDIVVLTAIGFGIGLGFSILSYYMLKWLRWRGAESYIEATYVLAMSYLVYWVTQSPCGGSGVIAVVTFGLVGNATMLWGMTGSAFKSGDFEAMWDMISFLANGLVFFWAGIASVSFLIPSIIETPKDPMAYASIVIIYLFMLIIRTGCVALFSPIFHLLKNPLSAAEILFVGWSGLRGAVSLILLATVSSGTRPFSDGVDLEENAVNIRSDIALWTTTFIILTLIVNGPLVSPLLKSFGLTRISRAASKVQHRAKTKILEYTTTCISKYQDDDSGAFLTGADWLIVSKYVDLAPSLKKFGRVRAAKPSGTDRPVDQQSYLNVLKVFLLTFWRWLKSLIRHLLTLRLTNFGDDDEESMYEYDEFDAENNSLGKPDRDGDDRSGSSSVTSDAELSYDEGFENECHFQSIERTLTNQISIGPADLEQGLSGIQMPIFSSAEDMDQVGLSGNYGQEWLDELTTGSLVHNEDSVDSDGSSPRTLQYYSSLPASSRAELYEGLKRNLERTRSHMITSSSKIGASATDLASKEDDTRPTIRDLSEIFSGVSENQPPTTVSPIPSTADSPQESPDDFDTYHPHTIAGTSAKQLQEELKRAEMMKMYRPSMEGRRRDLLGNKEPFQAFEEHFGRDFSVKKDGGDVSRLLAKRSNLHQLKREAKQHRYGQSESVGAVGLAQDAIPENRPRNFLHTNDQLDSIAENDENLIEIRSRVIAGLKRRFTKRRAEGRISLKAFQILDQTCQEQISSTGKIQMWSVLERKAQGGYLVKLGYELGFSLGKSYKRRAPWFRKLFHYPFSWINRLLRGYVGRLILIGCEMAIEYTLALAVSQHVRWLKLHNEYFSPLLDEVNEEAEKSHAFIIDREIEAPDTFRAIQSYRAAVVVLKDIQEYVETLLEVGIMSTMEAEQVTEHISMKLRKLEITGPVWRPAKFFDIMKSLRPFIGLDEETLEWVWDLGLFQEYRPGQAFFCEDVTESGPDGIFHILSGVAKKEVYSKVDGKLLKEEYLGVGSCFGVRRSLSLATGRQATVVYATGNALGRGTIVFRIMQNDVNRIMALSKSGSPTMHEIITRWTKVAALNVLEGSEDIITEQLEAVLAANKARTEKVKNQEQQDANRIDLSRHKCSISLSDILTSDTFGLQSESSSEVAKKVLHSKAISIAKDITRRLRREFLSSQVLYMLQGDTVEQTSTIVLLKGTFQKQGDDKKKSAAPVAAPVILPHLTEEEEEFLTQSYGGVQSTEEDKMIVWEVSSLTALVLIFPETSV
jgi:NhaP-type Na+/H+ or K+/H+ antiporter